MTNPLPTTNLAIRSLLTAGGELRLSLDDVGVPALGATDVLLRVDASPINPSDIGLMFGPADLSTLQAVGTASQPAVTARVPERAMPAFRARWDVAQSLGNEGAGVVIAAGASPQAQALVGKTVCAVPGGGMYAQYRVISAEQCTALPSDVTAEQGASAAVNPLTALGMVETLRREGHTALVHTAAASALGQMLVRLCQEENIALVNIVRSPAQAELLRGLGAQYVCDSSAPTFTSDLTDAIAATGATLAFDAIGGGPLAGQILACMESVLVNKLPHYSRYGSNTHKQVYVYGSLDNGPTELRRNYGLAWGIGGWLVFPYLSKLGPARMAELKQRAVSGLTTTFATQYGKRVSLVEALEPATLASIARRATGEKYLIVPSR